MNELMTGIEQEKLLLNICKGYTEIGVCCQQIIEVLLEADGRFNGGYSDLSRVLNLKATNVRKCILRVQDWGIFDVEFRATEDMTPMASISLNENWVFNLGELGKKGEHRAWHTK